jgi:hypothetical protein
MASWKKVIVSGSAAELSSLTLDTALPVAQGGIGASSLTDKAVLISQDSGTDTVGALALTSNGSIIVGGTGGPAVEAASDVAGTGLDASTGDGTLAINVAAAQTSITSVINSSLGKIGTAADQEYITFGTSNEVNTFVNNTERLSVTANGVDVTGTITNNGAVASSHITGSFTGSFVGDGTGLTGTGLDIDTLSEGTSLHQTQDHFVFSDNGTEKKITFSNLEDAIFGNVSGDATVAAGGALTIAANSVEGTMLNTNSADTSTIELSSDTLSVLKVPNALTVDNATIALNSGTTFDGSGAKTISVKDAGIDEDALATSVAGNGLTGGGGAALAVGAGTGIDVSANAIAVDVSDFMANGSNNRVLTATGTDGQNAEANLTFDGTTLTVNGNLEVAGTQTTVNSTNLLIEDRFILLNSGSTATGDGGILVGSGSAYSSSAFVFDDSEDRWGVQIDTQLGSTAATSIPEAYTSLYVLNANTGSATYNAKGNIKIDDGTGDIFIYS